MDGKLLAMVVAVCFGLNPVLLRLGFARAGPVDVAMILGLAISLALYIPLIPLAGGLYLEQVTLPALVGFVFGGLFGSGIGRRWLFIAIRSIGASPAVAIKNSAPLITTALAVLLLGEQVGLRQWVAIVAIILGLTLVTWQPGGGLRQLLTIGVLAAFGSAVSYGIRPLFLEFGLDQANLPLTAAVIGALAAFAYAVIMARPRSLALPSVAAAPLALFFVAGVLQGLGFLSLTFALSAGEVSIVYPVTATAPIFSLAFSWLLLRATDRLTLRISAGVIAVVGGVIAL